MTELEYLTTVLKATQHDEVSLWWREWEGNLRFFVDCSDRFAWACADAEQITPENVPSFVDCLAEFKDTPSEYDAPDIWVARRRGMRWQGAAYKLLSVESWPHIDACGPERLPGKEMFGNPLPRPADPEPTT